MDYAQVRQEIVRILNKPGWDDGSLGPVFVRLAWHASGTYDKRTNTGGSNGATMRYHPESTDPANAGLDQARHSSCY
jgi:cytochrome c peroxidase